MSYTKTVSMDLSETIDATLHRIHPCTCDEAYTSRKLIDPTCVWHDIQGDGALIVDDLAAAGLLGEVEAGVTLSDEELNFLLVKLRDEVTDPGVTLWDRIEANLRTRGLL